MGFQVCFSCKQTVHVKAYCPQLATRAVQTPTPVTKRITDGRHGKAEASRARGKAFQLTTEEARVTPNIVDGMCSLYFC